jgi:hypothetical protein
MKRFIILIILIFISACTNQSVEKETLEKSTTETNKAIWEKQLSIIKINDLNYDEANVFLQRSYQNSEHRDYTSKTIEFEQKHNFSEKEDCYIYEGEILLITITDENGVIQRIIPNIDNDKSKCYINLLQGKNFPEPPYAPFFDEWMM